MKKIILAAALFMATAAANSEPGNHGINTSNFCDCEGVGVHNGNDQAISTSPISIPTENLPNKPMKKIHITEPMSLVQMKFAYVWLWQLMYSIYK